MPATVQAKFFTKESQYSVSSEPIELGGEVVPEQLNALINQLLGLADGEVEFEFTIHESIIHLSLQEHLDENKLSTENVIEIEYFEKCPCPEPVDSFLHEDWVSDVHSAIIGGRELIISVSYDFSITIWTIKGKKLLTLSGHTAPVKAVRWLDSDNRFATFVSTSHDESAMLWKWDHQKNQIEATITCKGHQRSVDCVDVDPSKARFATAGFDNVVKVWSSSTEETELDVKKESESKKAKTDVTYLTRTPLVSLASHTEAVTGLEFSSSSEMITCGMDNTMKVWDVEIGGFTNNFLGSKAFLDLSYSKVNHTVLTANADRHIRLWDPRSKEGSNVKCNFTSHSGWVSSVCWSPKIETQFVSASYDGIFKLWDTRSPNVPLYDMEGHEDRILCCDWSLDEYMISGGADNRLKVFKHTAPIGKKIE